MTDMTPREYLVSLGLAKATRGRFGKEAIAALADARAKGMTFKEAEVKAPAPRPAVKAKPAPVEKSGPRVDPAAVRAWARDNGYTVGDRGRILGTVVDAFVASRNEAGSAVETVADPDDMFKPTTMRRRANDIYIGTDLNGKTIRRTFRDCCVACKVSIGWCVCPSPTVFSLVDTSAVVVLTGTDGSAQRTHAWS